MPRYVLTILIMVCALTGAAQRTAKVTATYIYYAPETMSVDEAKRTALERAKIQAIADEFGTVVSQSNTTVISNENGESDTRFYSYGGSDVKGEWIETIGEPKYEISFDDHVLVVSVTIKGTIRCVENHEHEISVSVLRNGIDLKNEDSDFKDGDDLYLRIKSTTDGYVQVFLVDYPSDNVYKLFPDNNQDGAIVENITYTLFYNDNEYGDNDMREFVVTGGDRIIRNDVVIMFSPRKFNETIFTSDGSNSLNYTKISDFEDWKSKFAKKPDNITINKPITIKP